MSEFCTECGEFFDTLNEWTGWCAECSQSTQPPSRVERWLIRYADTVEYVMQVQCITAKLAIIEVHAAYKATCIICGAPIKHGTHGRHFLCNSTPECKKARRRYKYLIYDKGLTKEAALAAITPQET
jgi:hypothetical protein